MSFPARAAAVFALTSLSIISRSPMCSASLALSSRTEPSCSQHFRASRSASRASTCSNSHIRNVSFTTPDKRLHSEFQIRLLHFRNQATRHTFHSLAFDACPEGCEAHPVRLFTLTADGLPNRANIQDIMTSRSATKINRFVSARSAAEASLLPDCPDILTKAGRLGQRRKDGGDGKVGQICFRSDFNRLRIATGACSDGCAIDHFRASRRAIDGRCECRRRASILPQERAGQQRCDGFHADLAHGEKGRYRGPRFFRGAEDRSSRAEKTSRSLTRTAI